MLTDPSRQEFVCGRAHDLGFHLAIEIERPNFLSKVCSCNFTVARFIGNEALQLQPPDTIANDLKINPRSPRNVHVAKASSDIKLVVILLNQRYSPTAGQEADRIEPL